MHPHKAMGEPCILHLPSPGHRAADPAITPRDAAVLFGLGLNARHPLALVRTTSRFVPAARGTGLYHLAWQVDTIDELAVDAVIASGGWGSAVTDEEAWAAQDLLATAAGIFVEPAAAVAVAAIISDARSGRLVAGDRPVAVLTGTGLKDLRRFAARAAACTCSGCAPTSEFGNGSRTKDPAPPGLSVLERASAGSG